MTLEAGWRAVYGLDLEEATQKQGEEEQEGGELPQLEEGMTVRCAEALSEAKETKAPPRYTEATLLSHGGAGKIVDDVELREAMKERGLGTPATRAEIIETLIRREYVDRSARSLRQPRRASR